MSLSLALVLALSSPAHALDCLAHGVGQMLPVDGAVAVPTNAMPVVELYGGGALEAEELVLELADADGGAVPVSVEVVAEGDPMVVRLVPEAPLAAGAGYVLSAGFVWEWDDEGVVNQHHFVVGDGPDTTPPAPVAVVAVDEHHASGDWGPEHDLFFETGELPEPEASVLLLGLSTPDASWDRARIGADPVISHAYCTFDDAAEARASELTVELVVVDLAGNRSDASVTPPAAEEGRCGTGCAVLPASTVGWLGGLVGLVGLARRRRR